MPVTQQRSIIIVSTATENPTGAKEKIAEALKTGDQQALQKALKDWLHAADGDELSGGESSDQMPAATVVKR